MKNESPLDPGYLSKIDFAMGCITFPEAMLDASLAEIGPALAVSFGQPEITACQFDMEHARVAMAHALAMAAAIQNIHTTSNLGELMMAVGFFDDADPQDVQDIKCVALDKILEAAIATERDAVDGAIDERVERLQLLREQAFVLMQARGHAALYFQA